MWQRFAVDQGVIVHNQDVARSRGLPETEVMQASLRGTDSPLPRPKCRLYAMDAMPNLRIERNGHSRKITVLRHIKEGVIKIALQHIQLD